MLTRFNLLGQGDSQGLRLHHQLLLHPESAERRYVSSPRIQQELEDTGRDIGVIYVKVSDIILCTRKHIEGGGYGKICLRRHTLKCKLQTMIYNSQTMSTGSSDIV